MLSIKNMGNLLTFKYWFNTNPESFILLAQIIFLSFLGLLLVAGIFFMIARRQNGPKKVLFNKLYDFCFVNLVLGLLLLFFNYQQIQFFSARFWLLIWLIIMIWWGFSISQKIKKIIGQRAERQKQAEFKKYLP